MTYNRDPPLSSDKVSLARLGTPFVYTAITYCQINLQIDVDTAQVQACAAMFDAPAVARIRKRPGSLHLALQ